MNRPQILTLTNRLEICCNKVGGKKQLASLTGISQPQLFRYLKEGSSMPLDRLLTIAEVAKVHLYWLISGEGEAHESPIKSLDPHPDTLSVDPDIFQQCIIKVETLLQQYSFPPEPALKSKLLLAVYKGIIYEQQVHRKPIDLTESKVLEMLAYLNGVQGEIPRTMLFRTIEVMEDIAKGKVPDKEIRTFANYISTAVAHYYAHPAVGQPYFDRIGYTLEPDTLASLNLMMEDLRKQFVFRNADIDILDLGCGNGRHLRYFSQQKGVRVQGLDNNLHSATLCMELEASGVLPPNTFTQGHMQRLPYQDNSFDLIFSNASLFHIPYFPEHAVGLNEQLAEIARVMRPKSYLFIHGRYGNGFEPFPFFQLHDETSIRALSEKHAMKMLWFKKYYWQDSVEYIPKSNFNNWFMCMLQAN